jgi:hypothetical protein
MKKSNRVEKKKPIKKLKKELWDLVSKYIRIGYAVGETCECYTCGNRAHWKHLQAGHAIAGRGNAILFDERILRPQCMPCNIYKHGNYQVFVPKLCKEIGQDLYEEIERNSHNTVKLSRQWYEDKIGYYKLKLMEFDLPF